ncbi:hypothetical protein H4219_006360, partial [Mycoemilia scoparia]
MPTSFYGLEKKIDKQAGYLRAVDWVDFLLYIVPTIVAELIDDPDDVKALISLVNACSKIESWTISEQEISEVEIHINKWHRHMLLRNAEGKIGDNFFTVSQHYLTHVPYIIRHCGPLRFFSSRPLERTIGHYTHRFKSRSSPGPHAGNILDSISMMNAYHRKYGETNSNHPTHRVYKQCLLKDINHLLGSVMLQQFIDLISNFFSRNLYNDINVNCDSQIILYSLVVTGTGEYGCESIR